jgi:hypothetical protein
LSLHFFSQYWNKYNVCVNIEIRNDRLPWNTKDISHYLITGKYWWLLKYICNCRYMVGENIFDTVETRDEKSWSLFKYGQILVTTNKWKITTTTKKNQIVPSLICLHLDDLQTKTLMFMQSQYFPYFFHNLSTIVMTKLSVCKIYFWLLSRLILPITTSDLIRGFQRCLCRVEAVKSH